jgi:transposase
MKFMTPVTGFYCGVDLHARSLYICVIDRQGKILMHRKIGIDPEYFLLIIQPWGKDITVAVESTFNWYWLADVCASEDIPFALAHALYLKAIHGSKVKNDRIDCEKIARIALGGNLPLAYAYPRQHRAVRDLLRRRTHFVRERAELMGHIQCLNMQENNLPLGASLKVKAGRATAPDNFIQEDVRFAAEANLAMIAHYDSVIPIMEKRILERASSAHQRELAILDTFPGIGEVTALTIIYEMDSVERFESRQDFCSYARLVKPLHESGGHKSPGHGAKIGNPHLKWAFSEAAVHAAQHNESIRALYEKLVRRHSKGRAKSILAHKIGRAVFHMLKNGTAFDEKKFLSN